MPSPLAKPALLNKVINFFKRTPHAEDSPAREDLPGYADIREVEVYKLVDAVAAGAYDAPTNRNVSLLPDERLKRGYYLRIEGDSGPGLPQAARLVFEAAGHRQTLRERFPVARSSLAREFMLDYMQKLDEIERGLADYYIVKPPSEASRDLLEFCWWFVGVVASLSNTVATSPFCDTINVNRWE